MPSTAIIIGLPETCRRVEQQLDLLPQRPISLGWVLPQRVPCEGSILGTIEELEAIVARRQPPPGVALICLPSAMTDLITSIRTRLRRLGIPDRFIPTLEDLLAGVGPRSMFDIDLAQLLDRPRRVIDETLVRRTIAGKRVLITGAGGSIGSELSRLVSRFDPQRLILIDRSENALFEIDRQIARLAPGLLRKALLHDIVDAPATRRWFDELQPQVIFHSAAHKHVPMMEDHPGEAVENNLFGTKSVVDAAHAAAAERFVMISTDKAVNPTSIMGATKRLAEMYVQHVNEQSGTGYAMVRFGNVLGSSGSVLEIWSRQLREGGPLTVTHKDMLRYFMTIPEAASLVIQAGAMLTPDQPQGEVYVLDMGEPVRVVDMARRFIELHGLRAIVSDRAAADDGVGSIRIVFTGARPGEKLFEELATDAECMQPTRHQDIHVWQVPRPDPAHIQDILESLSARHRPRSAAAVAAVIRSLVPEMQQPIAA